MNDQEIRWKFKEVCWKLKINEGGAREIHEKLFKNQGDLH